VNLIISFFDFILSFGITSDSYLSLGLPLIKDLIEVYFKIKIQIKNIKMKEFEIFKDLYYLIIFLLLYNV
jgi:hypothetical protein